jgi:hypothetical protein
MERRFDKATARSIASLVGSSGGLWDVPVGESDGPSCGRKIGVKERRSFSSLLCVRAEEGHLSSAWLRPIASPDQSPDTGRVLNSGEADSGVKEPGVSQYCPEALGLKTYSGCFVSWEMKQEAPKPRV